LKDVRARMGQVLFSGLALAVVLPAFVASRLGFSALASFGTGVSTMSWKACVLVVLLASGFILDLAGRGRARRFGVPGCVLAAAGLALSAQVCHPPSSNAPILSLGFLTVAVVLGLLAALPSRPWRIRQVAALLALAPLLSGAVLVFAYAAELPLFYETGRTLPSLPTALALVLLAHAALAACGHDTFPLHLFRFGPEELPHSSRRWMSRIPFLAFAWLALLASFAGVLFARSQAAASLVRLRSHLATLADNRVREMDRWLEERQNNARVCLTSDLHQQAFLACLKDGRNEAGIRSWMDAQFRGYGYERIGLCDSVGRPVVEVGRPRRAAPGRALDEALRTRDVTLADLYRDGGEERFGCWIPVLDHGRAAGAVELVVDLRQFVDPFLSEWAPMPPRGATVLVRRGPGALESFGTTWSPSRKDLQIISAPGQSADLVLDPGDRRNRAYVAIRPLRRVPWTLALRIRDADRIAALRPAFWVCAACTFATVLLLALGTGLLVRLRGTSLLRERLDRERERQALARRSTVLMQEANDVILLVDLEGRFLEGNRRAVDTYGYSLAELVKMHASELRAPEAASEFRKRWEELLAKGSGLWETTHRRRDGSILPVEVSARVVEQGGTTYVLSFLRDISERRAQAREIHRLTRLYAALGQVGQAMAWTQEREELFHRVCGVLVTFGGLRNAWIGEAREGGGPALIGWSGSPDDLGPFSGDGEGALDEVARTGRHHILEGFGISAAAFPVIRDGVVTHLLGVVADQAGFFGAGEVELLQETALDLAFALDKLAERDARARAESELRQSAEEQRRLEAQLQQSQKMESLGSLAGGVAHDLNNVLGAILSLASAHRENESLPGPLLRGLDTIINACIRGRDVVKSLLYFARKGLEKEGPLDLNAMVRDLAQLLAHTTLKRVKLDLDLAEGLPSIVADHGALANALMNLCVNAVDAMPGGGTLTIRTRLEPEGGLSLAVIDTGAGMEPEVLRRAMEPFFTTKPVGKGTGLGLSMVFGTLKAHGGTLELASRVGEGTRAVMHLPASRRVEAPPEPAPAREPERGRPLSILLVDDDELIHASVGPMLGVMGHTVISASGGEEALARMAGGLHPDLVILDMNMPGMTGAQALPRILAMRPDQPVVLASGHTAQDLEALQAGRPNVRQLKKPFSMDEMQELLAGV
jgi:PAS domain S-box-containing protein